MDGENAGLAGGDGIGRRMLKGQPVVPDGVGSSVLRVEVVHPDEVGQVGHFSTASMHEIMINEVCDLDHFAENLTGGEDLNGQHQKEESPHLLKVGISLEWHDR